MSNRRTSSSEFSFEEGDHALLIYIKRHRMLITPVVVVRVWRRETFDTGPRRHMSFTIAGYDVSSGRGGELRVSPNRLRPDTVLDRINAALNADELLLWSSS